MKLKSSLILFLAFGLFSCGGKNIHKDFAASKPNEVLSRKYAYMTRESTEAGVHPVEYGSPVAGKHVVFVASETRGLEAFEKNGFKRKWQFQTKNGVSSEVVLYDNVLYFGAGDGFFYALDAEFGRVLWRYDTKVLTYSRPTISGNRILFTASDDVVHCLDRANGSWTWHYKRTSNFITTVRGNSSPTVDGSFVYIGFSDGYVVALNFADGNIKWETKIHRGTKFTDVDASAVVDGPTLFIPSYDGELYSLDKRSGKVLWHVDVGGSKKVIMDGSMLYLAASNGQIVALEKASGKIVWKFDLDSGAPTNLVQYKNLLAFGSSSEYFYAIHKGDGSLAYRFDAGIRSGFVSAPFSQDKDLYILSNYGNLYQFEWKL